MQELQDTFQLAGPMPGVHEATEALMLEAPATGQAEGEAKRLAVPAAVDHVSVIPRLRVSTFKSCGASHCCSDDK